MKILHIGDTAGVPTAIRDLERETGHLSFVVQTYPHPFGYPVDFHIQIDGKNWHSLKNLIKLLKLGKKFDRIHSHKRPVNCGLDLLIFKYVLRKQIYLHYHGTDIRRKKQPFVHKLVADRTFVSTLDLLDDLPNAEWMPTFIVESDIPADLRRKYLKLRKPNTPLIFLHTPTDEQIKGTKFVNEAISRLKSEGYNIEYRKLSGLPHKEVLKEMATCDVYIDQLLMGIHGVSSLECACMGVPVVCNIKGYETPFINANKGDIYEVLRNLCEQPYNDLLKIGLEEQVYNRIIRKNLLEYCKSYDSPFKEEEEEFPLFFK